MADTTALTAISPIDGRYRSKTRELWMFSEGGLIYNRTIVEVKYLFAICKLLDREITGEDKEKIERLMENS